jgi:3-oxoacyl-[acyl-carrier protein] reductase
MPNRYDLAGRNAIVTGGARGIGRAIARLLAESGASVWIWDVDPVPVEGCTTQRVDVTRSEDIDAALMDVLALASRLDILVNDAGYLGKATPFAEHSAGDWQRILAVNLAGTMQVAQAVVPHMRRSGGGRIVNLGSLAGKEGLPGIAAYSAASGGVIAFTKALAREVIADNIFVNCVAPGPIDTGMIRNLGPDIVDRMIADSPMKRLGAAEEVAHLVAWLCSNASRFNTGAVFDMSGGRARY